MRKVIDVALIRFQESDYLVKEYIKDGWEPVGAAQIFEPSNSFSRCVFYQTMVKYENERKVSLFNGVAKYVKSKIKR
jgi:hypothetical protein